MNSNMVKPEQFDHLHLVYHFSVPLKIEIVAIKLNEIKLKFLKFYFLNYVTFCTRTLTKLDLQL